MSVGFILFLWVQYQVEPSVLGVTDPVGQIRKVVEKVDGWLTEAKGKLLYDLVEKCRGESVIVEIGFWKGKSKIWLAYGSKACSSHSKNMV